MITMLQVASTVIPDNGIEHVFYEEAPGLHCHTPVSP